MFHGSRKFNLCHGLAISLALHAVLIFPFLFLSTHMSGQHRHRHGRIAFELYGMVSNRQVEGMVKGNRGGNNKGNENSQRNQKEIQADDSHRQVDKTAAKQPVTDQKQTPDNSKPVTANLKQSADKYGTVTTDSPVHVAEGKSNAGGLAAGTTQRSGSGSGPQRRGGETQQRQQYIRYAGQNDSQDRIRDYIARLTRRIQANLIYPKEVKKNGAEGVSWVTFAITNSGEIKGGSLHVQRSSGYAAMDSSALKSVRLSAPFERPPKDNLAVSIGVSFEVGRS